WYGDYYGVMAFIVNTDMVKNVPADWSDLMKPEYAGAFALTGDPRSGNQGLMSVMSAGMAMGGAPGADSAAKGLEFMGALNKAGNFVPVAGKTGTIAQGATPIVAAWDYNALAWRDTLAGNPKAEVIIPASGTLAGVYVQAISAYAPHPNAAKLWMEYIYSDEGQLGWLNGYCHPIRFNDLAARGVIPADMLAKLPPAAAYEKAVFPTLEEQAAHKEAVTAGWDATVGVKVE
ncbi:MAG: ABC transporter substrate-binding protein, partial [Cypionkella sp.]|nr:ABC transporter substrate-binding protein [Cypionkella sp.]